MFKDKLRSSLPWTNISSSQVKACVSLVFSCEQDDWFLLVIKRAVNPNDLWSGHYAFPGGRLEKGEERIECARRECFEEVGLDPGQGQYAGSCNLFTSPVKPEWGIEPHVFFVNERASLVNDESEVAHSYWFPLSEFLDPHCFTKKSFMTFKGMRELPCLDYQGHVLWGISYSILVDLLSTWHNLEYLPGLSFQAPSN